MYILYDMIVVDDYNGRISLEYIIDMYIVVETPPYQKVGLTEISR